MRRSLLAALAASAALLGAASAHAGTHWSVGINLPVPGIVVSNGGYYAQEPAPVYYVPAPEVRYSPAPVVRYAPVPRYAAPDPYCEPQRVDGPPVVYSESEVVYETPYRAWRGDRDDRWERRREVQRARWEQARHDRWERRDEDDSRRWRRD